MCLEAGLCLAGWEGDESGLHWFLLRRQRPELHVIVSAHPVGWLLPGSLRRCRPQSRCFRFSVTSSEALVRSVLSLLQGCLPEVITSLSLGEQECCWRTGSRGTGSCAQVCGLFVGSSRCRNRCVLQASTRSPHCLFRHLLQQLFCTQRG